MTRPSLSVSVIIPSYNSEKTIARAIASITSQTHSPHEIIVVNDGSTDATTAILNDLKEKVSVIRQENAGPSAARNTGILAATGEFVSFLDADDYWAPQKLEKQIALLSDRSDLGFVSCHADVVDGNGNILNTWEFEKPEIELLPFLFTRHAGIPGSLSAVIIKRSLFARIGLFDTSLTAQEDVDMWIRLASVSNYECIIEPLVTICRQDVSVSTNFQAMLKCAQFVMKKNRYLLPQKYRYRFWRKAYSGMLSDYAKWALRRGDHYDAMRILLSAAAMSTAHWRLLLSIAYSGVFPKKD